MAQRGPQGLPKTARLRKRREFLKLSNSGGKTHSANFIVISGRNNSGECRLGITVSGKVGNAVTRNRIKRHVREFFRRRRSEFQASMDFIVIARAGAADLSGGAIADELARAFGARRRS